MASVLLTGAYGFVGRALRAHWRERGVPFVGAVRVIDPNDPHRDELVATGEYTQADWRRALAGVHSIVHLAARAHVMREREGDPETAYGLANCELTLTIARAGIAAGVRRLVFASSVKVNGESTEPGRCFTVRDPPAPQDAYARSKWTAEQGLAALAGTSSLECAVLRLPLVYGPGVKGNFLALMRWIARERWLPFGALDNRRSLLALANLISAIEAIREHPSAAGKTYLVADPQPVSTAQLCRGIATALGVRPRLARIPVGMLRLAGGMAGAGAAMRRLTGSLVIDNDTISHELGWSPPVSVDDGLRQTARWFLQAFPPGGRTP